MLFDPVKGIITGWFDATQKVGQLSDFLRRDPCDGFNSLSGESGCAFPQTLKHRSRFNPLAVSKGKEVWMTEHLDTDTSWSAVMGTAREIHDCMNAGMSAYVWWYIVRFYGPILEDGNVSKRGYVMSQYARFVRPGHVRVDATGNPQPDVYVTAYKNGSKMAIVAINANSSSIDQTFAIRNGTVSSFMPFVTSSTKNCIQGNTIPALKGGFTAPLEPSSVTTFVSN